LQSFYIINPVAGRGKSRRVWQQLEELLKQNGRSYSFAFTEGPGHAYELARSAAESGCRFCFSVGGDGTLSEIVPALLGSDMVLGCIPAGTGNDFARTLKLPRRLPGILHSINHLKPVLIDIPFVNGKPFINAAGAGFDAMVAERVNQERHHTRFNNLVYIQALFKTLNHYENAWLSLQIDDQPPLRLKSLLVAVGNGQYYGAGFRICPKADPCDGLLDVCIAGDISKPDLVVTLPRLVNGTHLSHRKCLYTTARQIYIDGPPLPIQTDGQITARLPALITIKPQAMRFLVTPEFAQGAGFSAAAAATGEDSGRMKGR